MDRAVAPGPGWRPTKGKALWRHSLLGGTHMWVALSLSPAPGHLACAELPSIHVKSDAVLPWPWQGLCTEQQREGKHRAGVLSCPP